MVTLSQVYYLKRKRTLVLVKSVADTTHIYIIYTGNVALNMKSLGILDKFTEGSNDRLKASYRVQRKRPVITVFQTIISEYNTMVMESMAVEQKMFHCFRTVSAFTRWLVNCVYPV